VNLKRAAASRAMLAMLSAGCGTESRAPPIPASNGAERLFGGRHRPVVRKRGAPRRVAELPSQSGGTPSGDGGASSTSGGMNVSEEWVEPCPAPAARGRVARPSVSAGGLSATGGSSAIERPGAGGRLTGTSGASHRDLHQNGRPIATKPERRDVDGQRGVMRFRATCPPMRAANRAAAVLKPVSVHRGAPARCRTTPR